MKKILITGGSGFIGRQVTKEFLEHGYDVTVINKTNDLPPVSGLNTVHLDLFDEPKVNAFMQEHHFEQMVHLAWYIGPKCHVDNINFGWLQASVNLLRAFQQNGGRKFLGAGTVSEYDFSYGLLQEDKTPLHNPSLHGQCKAAFYHTASVFCRQNNIDFKWARMFNLYGPYERATRLMPSVINSMLKGEDVKVSDCRKFQDYLHVYDTAHGLYTLFESNLQGAVNICSAQPICLRQIVEKIGELTNFKGKILWGAIPAAFGDNIIVGSNDKLKSLGWEPQYDLATGLTETINWWRTHNV